MPKLLIVDDEEMIRDGLASMVNRLLPGWKVVSKCEDAEQAWEQVNACSPDLALIDIGMTGMNGLELAARLDEEKPGIYKIMLTGYDKFSYVQSALRSGVSDYLLKPVQRNELVAAFHKAEKQIVERRRQRQLKLEKAATEWAISEKPESLALLQQLLAEEGWAGEGTLYGVRLECQYRTEAESGKEPERIANNGEDRSEAGSERLLHNDEVLKVTVPISSVCVMMFVAVNGTDTSAEMRTDYGDLTDNLSQLPAMFRQAQERMYRDMRPVDETIPADEAELMKRVVFAVEMDDLKATTYLLEQWRQELRQAATDHPMREFVRLFRFVAFVAGLQTRVRSALLSEMNAEIVRLSSRLLFTGDPAVLLSAIDHFVDGVARLQPKLFDERKLIGKVKEIMRKEFMNPDFSLELAAGHVHLNATYLSELFKETTGRKFIDYLTDIRLEEARRLLQETDMKMYEVCLSVGYTSSKYFSTLFRKKFDVTPTMYREGPGGGEHRDDETGESGTFF
ncbi:response regulator [Cohnella soli]|uniref:Response regulator n=1 Tax=Cohnella soli TaxID=425005 RepID=A0ABW0HSV0_9BACL